MLTSTGYGKRSKMAEFRKQQRGGMGVKAMKLTRTRGILVAARCDRPGLRHRALTLHILWYLSCKRVVFADNAQGRDNKFVIPN